jgi:glucose-6-phosphate isomerase
MRFSFSDTDSISGTTIAKDIKKLHTYRQSIEDVIATRNIKKPEYALHYASEPALHETLAAVSKQYAAIKHLVVVGIGGSSLGLEAVHSVLNTGAVKLTVLDTLAANEIDRLHQELSTLKKVNQLAVCVISKSGNTPETLVNASVLLESLKKTWGGAIYAQTLFIGNAGTDFMKAGKRLGATCVAMPEAIGGRYSVATEVGLVPLALLKHDVDSYIEGILAASEPELEEITLNGAVRLHQYIQKGFKHYNFFAFEKRLETLGAWYRQLFAESLGKSLDKDKKLVTKGMLPTISTPVELHSIGQLYLSGFAGVYTDFVTFDDETTDFAIAKQGIAKAYGRFSVQEVTTALYGGVIGAYNEQKLPYKTTIFEDELAYDLGVFMGMRLREVMYVAELMNLNAFDQPNVELYKKKTKAILGL